MNGIVVSSYFLVCAIFLITFTSFWTHRDDWNHDYRQFGKACASLHGTIADPSYNDECVLNGKVVLFK